MKQLRVIFKSGKEIVVKLDQQLDMLQFYNSWKNGAYFAFNNDNTTGIDLGEVAFYQVI